MPSPRLSRATLGRLAPLARPLAYEPSGIRPGIVHLGLGNFHRAHMARYTHELMEQDGSARDWGIIGAGLLPGDRRMRDALSPQDGLYLLSERDDIGEQIRVIGSIVEVAFAGDGSEALLDTIDRSEIRIVSLTVTEHGYCLDAAKRLDPDHPAIVADLATPEAPRTAIGIVAEAYRRRMSAGRAGFTTLSCDNIQHNGGVLRQAVLDYAALRDPALADWIVAEARFPSTMVDRITPVTQAADAAALAERAGVLDAWPVFSEPFSQWVIEDDFVGGARPSWDAVGAQFTGDVAPYEFMKLRLLNASHLAISGLGRLIGHVHVDEAMRDPLIGRYMAALMDRETGPTLMPVPGIDLPAYKAKLIARFANSTIKDTVERVNTDAPLNYLLDPIRDRIERGQSIDLLALGVAAWMRRIRGEDEAGAPIDVRHPLAELLRARAIAGGADPRPLLGVTAVFGALGGDPSFAAATGRWLGSLYSKGAAATLADASETLGF